MKYLFSSIVIIYALLSIIASVVQIVKTKKKEFIVMLTGGCLLLTGVIVWLLKLSFSWIVPLAGLLLIALGAWINSTLIGKRHLQHHIIRWILSLIILYGFIIL